MFQPLPADLDGTDTNPEPWTDPQPNPEAMLLERLDHETINLLVAQLPAEYREVLILREIEELSYKEIADVTGVPAGTVMSRLSRARLALRKSWVTHEKGAAQS